MYIRHTTTYRKLTARALGLLALVGVALVGVSCSDDVEQKSRYSTLELAAFTRDFNVNELPQTRAMPAGFSPFSPADGTDIDVFVCEQASIVGHDVISNNNGHWRTKIKMDGGKQYYVYGYLPKSGAATATADALEGSYENGTVLTLGGISPVGQSDLCVVVGVKQGNNVGQDISIVDDLRMGIFSFMGKSSSEDNVLYMLLDHIYSSVDLQMRINATYSTLREIRLKSVQLLSDVGGSMSAQITLRANNTGSDPIEAVIWQSQAGTSSHTAFSNADGLPLTTTYQDISSCVMAPTMNGHVTLRCVYDVYDTDGNLIRADEQSENVLPTLSSAARGEKNIIRITVNPTYLYMLSDPDLNNPTLSFDSN